MTGNEQKMPAGCAANLLGLALTNCSRPQPPRQRKTPFPCIFPAAQEKITKRIHFSLSLTACQSTTYAKTVPNRHQKRTPLVAPEPWRKRITMASNLRCLCYLLFPSSAFRIPSSALCRAEASAKADSRSDIGPQLIATQLPRNKCQPTPTLARGGGTRPFLIGTAPISKQAESHANKPKKPIPMVLCK
jgi:hypothetical protein